MINVFFVFLFFFVGFFSVQVLVLNFVLNNISVVTKEDVNDSTISNTGPVYVF